MNIHKTDAELIEQAQELHTEVQTLLFDNKLLSTIQQFGPAFLHGSVKLGLLVRRDVDIYIQLPNDLDTTTFFAIGAAINQQLEIHKASYSNHFIRNFPGFNHGLFWGIQINHQGQKWKLGLWGYGAERFKEHCAEFNQLQKTLKTIDPVIILRIKDALRDGENYRSGISGNDIYTAVITANIKTTEQFDNWWKDKTSTSVQQFQIQNL